MVEYGFRPDSPQVLKYDSSGTLLNSWGTSCNPDLTEDELDEEGFMEYACTDPDGLEGPLESGDSSLLDPLGLAVDSTNGYVYIADRGGGFSQSEIKKFTLDGQIVEVWKSNSCAFYHYDYELEEWNSGPANYCLDPDGVGSLEVGDGEFPEHVQIAADSDGFVYVTDSPQFSNNDVIVRIQKFDSNGHFQSKWKIDEGEFGFTGRIYVDEHGSNYVTLPQMLKIAIFSQ